MPDRSTETYRELIENIPAITFAGISYSLGDIDYISPQVKLLLGVSPEEWLANPQLWFTLLHPDDAGRVLNELSRAWEQRQPVVSEYRLLTPSGEEVWVEHSARVRGGGEEERVAGLLTVITARKHAEEQLRNLAFIDELTQLYNRRGFFHLAERQLRLSGRTGRGAVLIFLDVDGMKKTNDERGHAAGDRLLMDVADLLRSSFRGTDLIARIGGDEFVVLAVETDTDRRELLSTRLQMHLDRINAGPRRDDPLSLSAGEAYFDPDSETTLHELLREADSGMYRHKFRK